MTEQAGENGKTSLMKLSCTKAFDCSICRYEHTSRTLRNLRATFSIISPPTTTTTTTTTTTATATTTTTACKPVLLLWLSGLTCTDENFIQKAGAAQYARQYNVHVLCADTSPRGAGAPHEDDSWDFGTGAGFYVDATQPGYEAYQMKSYIMQELLPLVREHLVSYVKVSVSGHSMGGMGALQLAFNHPQVFSSVSAFAPICHPSVVPWGLKCFARYLGQSHDDGGGKDGGKRSDEWAAYDPCEVIKQKGKLFHDVLVHQGDQDSFLEEQLKINHLQQACDTVGQKVSIHLVQGYDHSYFFVQSFIGEHIRFHAQAMGVLE